LLDVGGERLKVVVGFQHGVATFRQITVAGVHGGAEGGEFCGEDGLVLTQPMIKRDAIGHRQTFNGGLKFGDGGHGKKVGDARRGGKRDFSGAGYSSAK